MGRDEVSFAPSRSGVGCVLWGCLATGVVLALAVGSCTMFVYQGKRALDPFSDAFFAAWDSEDYVAVQDMIATALPPGRSVDSLVESVRTIRGRLGAVVSRRPQSFNVVTGSEGGTAEAEYRVQFTQGEGLVQLSFVKEGDRWALSGVAIESSGLESEWVCPNCGFGNPIGSRYCGACGHALSESAGTEAVEL